MYIFKNMPVCETYNTIKCEIFKILSYVNKVVYSLY